MRKLGNRVPAVLAGEAISLDDQLAQWEERKALEKSRSSSMDDVPTAQPALALAQKVIARVSQAGLPADLIPAALTSVTVSADLDAENALRTAVLEFMDTVRHVEKDIAAGRCGEDVPEELDVAALGVIAEEEWRAYWPAETEATPRRSRRRTGCPSRRRPRCRNRNRWRCPSRDPWKCPSRRPRTFPNRPRKMSPSISLPNRAPPKT